MFSKTIERFVIIGIGEYFPSDMIVEDLFRICTDSNTVLALTIGDFVIRDYSAFFNRFWRITACDGGIRLSGS